jgi:hypothetical protein
MMLESEAPKFSGALKSNQVSYQIRSYQASYQRIGILNGSKKVS